MVRVQLAVGTSVLVVERISQNGRVERTLNTIVPVAEVVASRNAMTSSERMM